MLIQEYTSSSLTSTKQFVWSDGHRRETRDASSSVLSQFFALGELIGGTKYFYSKDQIGSTREMTDSSGNIQAQIAYDPFGRTTKLQGSLTPDFQYAGYYLHGASGLDLTLTRPYSSALSRFINRDPIEGENLYSYTSNQPIDSIDPAGSDWVKVTRWNGVANRHTGLLLEFDTALGPIYFTVDGMPGLNNKLWVRLRRSTIQPPLMIGSWIEPRKITTDPKVVLGILEDAETMTLTINNQNVPYNVLPEYLPFIGVTSNQVTGTLLRNAGLPLPGGAPGIGLPLPPYAEPEGDFPPCGGHGNKAGPGGTISPVQTTGGPAVGFA